MKIQSSKKPCVLLLLFAAGFGSVCSWPLLRAEESEKPLAPSQAKPKTEAELKQEKRRLQQEAQAAMNRRQAELVRKAQAGKERKERLVHLEAIQNYVLEKMIDKGSAGERIFAAIALFNRESKQREILGQPIARAHFDIRHFNWESERRERPWIISSGY